MIMACVLEYVFYDSVMKLPESTCRFDLLYLTSLALYQVQLQRLEKLLAPLALRDLHLLNFKLKEVPRVVAEMTSLEVCLLHFF